MSLSKEPITYSTKTWIILGSLMIAAIAVCALPTMGMGGHLNYILYLVATHQISPQQGISEILLALPGYLAASPQISGAVQWLVYTVLDEGVAGIGIAIADLMAGGGIVGLALAIIGTATLG